MKRSYNRKFIIKSNELQLIQRFNPACRAARLHSHLLVSKFLILLTDFDLNLTINHLNNNLHNNNYKLNIFILQIISIITSLLFIITFLLSILPEFLRDTLLELSLGPIINLNLIAFILLIKHSLFIFILIIISFISILLIREYYALQIRINNNNKIQPIIITEAMIVSNDVSKVTYVNNYDTNDKRMNQQTKRNQIKPINYQKVNVFNENNENNENEQKNDTNTFINTQLNKSDAIMNAEIATLTSTSTSMIKPKSERLKKSIVFKKPNNVSFIDFNNSKENNFDENESHLQLQQTIINEIEVISNNNEIKIENESEKGKQKLVIKKFQRKREII